MPQQALKPGTQLTTSEADRTARMLPSWRDQERCALSDTD